MEALTHRQFYLKYGFMPEFSYTDRDGHLLTKSQALVNCRKKYIRGQLVEIMVCSAPVFNGVGYEALKRNVSKRVHHEGDQTDDDGSARRRAVRRLRDLIRCNDWRYFVTITFDGDLIDRTDYGAVIKKVNTFLDNRVRRSGWKYIGVVEHHKDGKGLHFHFLVDGDLKIVDSGTVIRPTGGRPVRTSTAIRQGFRLSDCRTVYNLSDWKLGFSTAIEVYGNVKALARYVGKYLTKSEGGKIGGRWFYHGGDLSEPVYEYDNRDFDSFVGSVDFDTDGGSFKILYLD